MNKIQENQHAKEHLLKTVRNMINLGRFREAPNDTYRLRYIAPPLLLLLKTISEQTEVLILEAFEVMADRVLKLLRPEVLYAITAHLEQLEVFIVALTAEMEDGSLCLGLTSELPNGNYVVVAKQRNRKDRTRFELGSTIFHELVHVATWSDRKVDLDEYQDIYQYYYQTIGLDNFTSVGRIDTFRKSG